MRTYQKGFLVIIGLILATSVAFGFIQTTSVGSLGGALVASNGVEDGLISIKADMVQNKVLKGSDGEISMAVTLAAARLLENKEQEKQDVDLVIVLDRSGSMQGEKIQAARRAVKKLIDRLTPNDRLALVTYSDGVWVVSRLIPMNETGQGKLVAAIDRVRAGGGTNLGGGLSQGIDLFIQSPEDGRQRKVILISDGLANRGVTDPDALGRLASAATDHHFAVSTVGVGLDFNEQLMTTIADHGIGRYYFLEDPLVFAQVFEKEFQDARQVAAAGMELHIPLENGVRLVDAGGYPIKIKDNQAIIYPGSLVSGQKRKLFLTFQVPTDLERTLSLGGLQLHYQQNGKSHRLACLNNLEVDCVNNEKEVLASVDKDMWGERVVRDEYNQLKEEVADAVRKGDEKTAQECIEVYEKRNLTKNAAVGSSVVTEHLNNEVKALRQSVADTFVGEPAAVVVKQKKQSKALQYESYKERRSK